MVCIACAADLKGKAPVVPGLRKPETLKPASVPKPPAAPKEVPGLPGVIQRPPEVVPVTAAPSPPAARPASVKRKAPPPPADKTPVPAKQVPSRMPLPPPAEVEPISQSKSSKRSKRAAAPPKAATSLQPAAPLALPPSPESFTFSPLPGTSDLEKQLEESRRNFLALQAVYQELQDENTALKQTSIREQVEDLFAQHTERVLEHGEKASELAAHWREEAERMAALLAESRVEEVTAQNRSLRAELATARQALLDMEVEKTEKDKSIVELQKRNVLLERYARKKPPTVDKCVGTDEVVPVMQARAMAPEGAEGSSMYKGFHPSASAGYQQHNQYQQQQPQGPGADAPYSLRGQRTVAHAATAIPSGSDMQLASVGQPYQQQQKQQQQVSQFPTAESVQAQGRAGMRGRRVSAPPAPVNLMARPGQTAIDVSRQIQFYSNSLSAVPEEEEPAAAAAVIHADPPSAPQQQRVVQQQPSVAPSSGPVLSRGQALMMAAHMDVIPLKGGKFQYAHQPTGYCFVLGNCPDPEEPHLIVQHYQPISLGTAEPALREAAKEVLLEEGWFSDDEAEAFFALVLKALALCANRQRQQQHVRR